MKQYMDFVFNGESSLDKEVFNSNGDNGGLFEENFLAERTLNMESIKYQSKGYLLHLERSPFLFTLHISTKTLWTRAKIDSIASWFDVNYFKEFYFLDQSDRRFFAMPTGSITFHHTGAEQGYLEIEMQSQSAYSYSPIQNTEQTEIHSTDYTLSSLTINNTGHKEIKPIIRLTKIGAGDIHIKHVENDGKIFEILNLADGEELYINNDKKEIVSDLENVGVYHYDDHNGTWINLLKGNNTLQFLGDFFIEVEYRFTYSTTL